MEELAEMLQQAQSACGPAGFGRAGGEGGFPGFGNPANVPQFPGGGSNVIPAAFGRRNKKRARCRPGSRSRR
jgi:hypothetical protein